MKSVACPHRGQRQGGGGREAVTDQTVPCTATEGSFWPKRSRLLCGARECGKNTLSVQLAGVKGIEEDCPRVLLEVYFWF